MDDNNVVTIYHKWPKNTFNNLKARNQIFKPHSLTSSFITSNILCLHSGSSCKSLFNTLPRNGSFCHHKNKARSRLSVVRATSKIRIRITNDLKLIKLLKGQHMILSSLQISEDLFNSFPMIQTWILKYLPKALTAKAISRQVQT